MRVMYDDKMLHCLCEGANFKGELNACRLLNMKYDPSSKTWSCSIGKLDALKLMIPPEQLTLTQYDIQGINECAKSMFELKVVENRKDLRKFHPELLKYLPV